MKTKTLEAGADLMQDKAPIRTLNAYMDGDPGADAWQKGVVVQLEAKQQTQVSTAHQAH